MKLMVVDDNAQIREGICQGIPWENYGFKEVRAYENGKDAYDALKDYPADMMIVDICMPKMDGLELLKLVRKKLGEECKFILLSAYSEFQYAQEAIRFGADDYILKPVQPKSLIELVMKHKKELLNDRQDNAAYFHVLEKSLLHMLMTEETLPDVEQIRHLLEQQYGMKLQNNLIYIAGLCVDSKNEEIDMENLRNQLRELMGNEEVCILPHQGYRLLLFGKGKHSQAANLEQFQMIGRKITGWNLENNEKKITCAFSHVFYLQELDKGYAQVRHALENAFYEEKGTISYANDKEAKWQNEIPQEEYIRWENLFADAIKHSNLEQLKELEEELLAWGKSNVYEPAQMRKFLKAWYRTVSHKCNFADNPDVEREIRESGYHLSGILESCRVDWEREIRKQGDLIAEEGYSTIIRNVCKYLKNHYNDPVTVEMVAELYERTPNYISSRFKKEVGRSFTDYLMEIRVNRAIYLLENSMMPIQQIAENTGFGSYAYFSRIIKKQTGKSAGEFRKNTV